MQNKKQKTLPEGRSPLELVYSLPNIRYTEYTTVSPREGPETTWYTQKKGLSPRYTRVYQLLAQRLLYQVMDPKNN